jgi:flagellar L-ring protein precursor FlgH
MKYPNRSTPLVLLSALVLESTLALAQTPPSTPPAASAAEQKGAAGTSDPKVPRNNSFAVRAGVMMARSGGSLLQASMTLPVDAAQVKLSQVSFFSVAEKEPKVLKKHDLVQIIIKEESSASSKAQNDLKKNVELSAQIAQMIQLKLGKGEIKGLPTPTATPGIDWTGARTYHGEGEMDRSDTLTARITAEIVDVKPNGTLVVQARKHIKTDDEDQQFSLTGTCRAEDITPDNTLLSTQLYDMQILKNSRGDVRESTERGRLPKLLDFINPF